MTETVIYVQDRRKRLQDVVDFIRLLLKVASQNVAASRENPFVWLLGEWRKEKYEEVSNNSTLHSAYSGIAS